MDNIISTLDRVLDALEASTGPTDSQRNGEWLELPRRQGETVLVGIRAERWEATLEVDGEQTPLEDGPATSAPDDDVVAWIRRCCDAEPDSEPRTYCVGLPVVITVHTDGRVEATVDLSEASDLWEGAMHDDQGEFLVTEDEIKTDIRRVSFAVKTDQVGVS